MDRGAWWLQSIGSQRVGHDWGDSACMQAPPGSFVSINPGVVKSFLE